MSIQKHELKCILMYIKKMKKNKLVDKEEPLKNLYDEGKLIFRMTTNQMDDLSNLTKKDLNKYIVKSFNKKVNNIIVLAIKEKKRRYRI